MIKYQFWEYAWECNCLPCYSEEGNTAGLGWLDAETVKFNLNDIRHKVPHMGWNSIEQKKESLLLQGISG